MKSKLLTLFQDIYKNEKRNLQVLCIVLKVLQQLGTNWDAYIEDCGGEAPQSRKALDRVIFSIETAINSTNDLIYRVEHPED